MNGIYHVDTDSLREFDDGYRWATVRANYRENVRLEDARTFFNFVKTSLDYESHPEKTEFLLEVIGYCLSDYTSAKLAFFFIGEPSSGKSKILEFLQRLLEDHEVSQISLPRIGDKFSMGQLKGKRLNICTEFPSNQFPAIEEFKALTANDRVYGELKFKDGFSFYPRIKLLNAGNSIPFPKQTDGTRSIVSRMSVLLFNHSISRDRWDTHLVDKLLEEKDIICSLAVKRLKGLADNNFAFTQPEDSRIFLSGYADALDAFRIFIAEACIEGKAERVSSQRLWEAYREFCDSNAFPTGITQQIFVQKVAGLAGVHKKRIWEDGRQITVFMGISIRSIAEELCRPDGKDGRADQDCLLSDNGNGRVGKGCTPCTAEQKWLEGGEQENGTQNIRPHGRGTVQWR